MSVIPFQLPERADAHLAGEGLCIGCRHEWAAAAPVGVWQLECPACGTMKGVWRYPVGADTDDILFICACGCEALTAYMHERHFRLKCMSCGTEQTEAVFG